MPKEFQANKTININKIDKYSFGCVLILESIKTASVNTNIGLLETKWRAPEEENNTLNLKIFTLNI